MLISDRIFELMKKHGMTQKEFSLRTGIAQSTISDWKGKRLNPSLEKINIICKVLGTTPTALLSQDKEIEDSADFMLLDRRTGEYELMEDFRKMDEGSRDLMMAFAKKLAGRK